MKLRPLLNPFLFIILVVTGCSRYGFVVSIQPDSETEAARNIFLPEDGPTEEDYPALHNLLQITDTIYSGGEPQGEESFASLARLGVKTIVSVDGATPDVVLVEKYGLRYVHIPIGYDGIGEQAGLAFASVMQNTEGSLYFHCHHGIHRGPAAAAAACVAGGLIDNIEALSILERAGTSTNYAGLWRDVGNYQAPAANVELPELVEIAETGDLAAAMAQIDRSFDNLKLVRDANWSIPENHPDIVPAQEALLVKEALRESGRNLTDDFDDSFRTWLSEAEIHAQELEDALQANDTALVIERFQSLEVSCKQCHGEYRN